MGRIRSIHPGIWTNEDFAELSDGAKLLLIGLWGESDDGGIFEWRPVRLKMRLRAWDGGSIDPLLAEISASDAVKRFEHDGRSYGAIKNFRKWQRPKSPQLLHPCPDHLLAYLGTVTEADRPERGTALGKILCEKQNGECHYCGTEITFYRKKITSLEVDHAVPISRGGEDDIGNLVAACKPCNSLKNSMTAEEFRDRFTVEEMRANSDAKRNSQTAKDASRNCEKPVAPRENTIRTDAKTCRGEATIQMEDGGGRMEKKPPTPIDSDALVQKALGVEFEKPKSPSLELVMEAAGMTIIPDDWQACFDKWKDAGGDLNDHVIPAVRALAAQHKERGGRRPFKMKFFDSAVLEKIDSDKRLIESFATSRQRDAENARKNREEEDAKRAKILELIAEFEAEGRNADHLHRELKELA